jgi:hypothetical protein
MKPSGDRRSYTSPPRLEPGDAIDPDEPVERVGPKGLGPTGQEHDLVVAVQPTHQGRTLFVDRIAVRVPEERVPVLGARLELVQAVPDVGHHTIDVHDRQRGLEPGSDATPPC